MLGEQLSMKRAASRTFGFCCPVVTTRTSFAIALALLALVVGHFVNGHAAESDADKPDSPAPVGMSIEEGREFWSFKPVANPPVPDVRNPSWVRTPIDAFVLAKLEANGLQPAPPADKRTLIRRVTFDLVGLPPTPSEVEAFLADESPDAFQKVVDRLLESPGYAGLARTLGGLGRLARLLIDLYTVLRVVACDDSRRTNDGEDSARLLGRDRRLL